jgi:murein DD-endopeptidase MepM/ murein hydrolase activator NlpD
MRKISLAVVAVVCALNVPVCDADENLAVSRLVSVEWPADYTGAAAPLPDPRLADINSVLLPVLIPDAFYRAKSFQVVTQDSNYTASVLLLGAKLAITGTRVAVDPPGKTDDKAALQDSVITSYSEGLSQATTVKYGAAYLATVECANLKDPRCANGDYVRDLLSRASFVGGGKGDPQPIETGAAAPLPPQANVPANFSFRPPGELVNGSGKGVISPTVYAPGIRFPVEQPPAYLNSQVWGIGGQSGPKGNWKDAANYAYPWRDNFCETRSRPTPSCPSGKGHQGVDIRPVDFKDLKYWAVAVDDGVISNVGFYSVTLQSRNAQYRYLHMNKDRLAVKQGDHVIRGQHLGLISNEFSGTPTPVHLHFEILQNRSGKGIVHVPPYTSLVQAYKAGN